MWRRWTLVMACALPLVTADAAFAWLRAPVNWAELLDEAEVIAVGRVVGDFVYVAHERKPDEGRSWEFHGRLAIDEVLKGDCERSEIDIVLHYGLTPSAYLQDGEPKRALPARDRPGVAIWDTGHSAVGFVPMVDDVRQPAVWYLGHYTDRFGRRNQPTEQLGVREPAHIAGLTVLPFLRQALAPNPIGKQLEFLTDPDTGSMWLSYFVARDEKRAFPAVAQLLADGHSSFIRACAALGGRDAIPYIRPSAASEDVLTFWLAAEALAELHDPTPVPRLLEFLATAEQADTRVRAASALGRIGDASAVPGLIAALKDDGWSSGWEQEVWRSAHAALEQVTRCRLSPNGEKARQWWEVAQHLEQPAWERFGIAQTIESLLILGPNAQEQADWRLRTFAAPEVVRSGRFSFGTRKEYDPVGLQRD